MTDWSHQERAIVAVRESIGAGRRWPLLVLPTGGGKTHIATRIASLHVAQGGRVLWLAHRDELVGQAADALTAAGLSVGCVQASGSRIANPHRPVQVASTQTLQARGMRPDATLVVCDEARHYVSEEWVKVVNHYRTGSLGLGLDATPARADGLGLDVFDNLIVVATTQELTDAGVLVPCDVIHPDTMLKAGELAQSPVVAYLAHCPGRKAICFAPHIKAAELYRDEFRAAGVTCELVTGKTPKAERRALLKAYAEGRVTVLMNVNVLTEGFDDRATEVCILSRSVGSMSLYLQMVGRVLRACPGKTSALLLDLHGAIHAFGHPAEDREYSLDGKGIRRKGAGEFRFCPVHGCVIEGLMCGECEAAGITPEGSVIPTIVNAKLVPYAAKRRESEEQMKAYYRKLQATARDKGYNPKQAAVKFKAIYGVWPKW